jgi:SAM-dependent methyltransferase
LSDRQLAKRIGASNTFVSNVRKELEDAGELSIVDTSIGSDGKTRPRKVIAVLNPSERTLWALRDEEVVQAMVERGVSARRAQEGLRKAAKAERKDISRIKLAPDFCQLHIADIANGLPFVADDSIDCIITDPPYAAEYLHLWEHLGKLAARVLKPGGLLLAMAGQHKLDAKMTSLSKYLKYHWTLAVLADKQSPALHWMGLAPKWKPVLLYTKDKWLYTGDVASDLIKTTPPGDDTSHHHSMARLR